VTLFLTTGIQQVNYVKKNLYFSQQFRSPNTWFQVSVLLCAFSSFWEVPFWKTSFFLPKPSAMLRLSLLLLCLLSLPCLGQVGVQDNQQVYRVVIEFTEGKPIEGILYTVQDSMIRVMPKSLLKAKREPTEGELLNIPVSGIMLLKIRKLNALKKGLWKGALAGAVSGAFLGYVLYSPCQEPFCLDFGRSFSIYVGVINGSAAGTGIGILLGSGNEKFQIKGSQENYAAIKAQLLPFTYSSPAQANPTSRQ
jgi:hypothetical protein